MDTAADAAGAAMLRPEAVCPEWLASILAEQGQALDIERVRVEPVGTGQLGETVRLHIGYGAAHGARHGPETLIAKFATTDANSRSIASAWKLYEREVGFYRQLAPRAGVRTPRCHGSVIDANGDFVLLLEDCSPARTGDQIAGISKPDALRAMREGARLHAAFWGQGDDPALAWLDTGPETGAGPERLAQAFYDPSVLRALWPGFRDRYADRLSHDMITVCDRFAERYEAYSRLLDRPRCVTHNDFRPDNMLFGADGALWVVDWQSAGLGHNAVDIAYLIGGAFTPSERRLAEADLLDAYHQELLARGVSGYSRGDLAQDYRHFSFAGINVAVGAAMMVKRTERGDTMFLTMLERHVAHVMDTGALAILSERSL